LQRYRAGRRLRTPHDFSKGRKHIKPELHADAAKNFNKKADSLLTAIAPELRQGASEPPTELFRPGGHIAARYSADELPEFKITAKTDLLGRTTARYFEYEGQRIGLEDDKYQELARLSESVQRTKALRDLVSTKWVEDAIVDWMKARYEGTSAPPLATYLADKCEKDVREHEILLPVSNLTVESDLTFGNVVFRTITKELMDRWWEQWQEATRGRGAEYAAKVEARFARERSDLQGLAAATIKVTAEPKRALEVALQESERAVAALRVYHIAATTIPEVISYCALLGKENVESVKYLEMEGVRVRSRLKQPAGGRVLNWHLSDDNIRKYTGSIGFDNVNRLLALKTRTKFQDALLDALLLYSRSTREKDLAGRLVYMLAAIESMLLRNDTESIQENAGVRMAFVIANTAEQRKVAISNLKAAYALRSRFLHHGHTIDELEMVRTFMLDTWVLFTELAKASNKFETKDQLIDSLEAMKLS